MKKTLIVSLLGLCLITYISARCFSPDQIEICNDDLTKCFCRTCNACPVGYGLNFECSGRLNKRLAKLKCEPCVSGGSYSDQNNTATCQPCPQCDGHIMLKPCTPRSPTVCSPDKCKKGFIWNSVVQMCEPDQKPTKRPTTIPTAAPTTQPSPTRNPPTSSKTTPKLLARPTTKREPGANETSNDEALHLRPSSKGDPQHKNILIVGVVTLGVIVAAFIGVVFYCFRKKLKLFFKKRCAKGKDGQHEENIPLQVKQDSPQPTHQDPTEIHHSTWGKHFLLKEIRYNLREQIETCISNPEYGIKGWRQIGQELRVDDDTLDRIQNCAGEVRGNKLMETLKTSQPKLTLTKFVDVASKLSRNDIVEKVQNFFSKINDAANGS